MLTTYDLDGTKTVFQFNWPYLDRSHIMVTVDLAARPFKFIDDHTISVKTLFGEPLPEGRMKIFRVTPDLDAYADFKDASKLTAWDLNRARLQCLFLIQERSGGLGGSVSQAVQLLTNEIETISGALDTLSFSQGVLSAGLQTLSTLGAKLTVVENEGVVMRDAIAKEIADRVAAGDNILTRMDGLTVRQDNLLSSVNSSIATLAAANLVQASRVDELKATVDAIKITPAGDGAEQDTEELSAAIITSAIAQVKNGVVLSKRIDSLAATVGTTITALIQTETTARVSADGALAQQITTLQTSTNGSVAQLQTNAQATADKVGNLNAQWTMKAIVQRADGKPVFAGIGLAATANNDLSKSEIVMQADRLVFVAADAVEATPQPIFTAGLVDGSPTFIVSSNRVGDRTYPGRILVDGTIEARSLAVNSITADKIAAGAITAEKLDVTFGSNLLKTSQFVADLVGWDVGSNLSSLVSGINGAGDAWHPPGMNFATLHQTSAATADLSLYGVLYANNFPVTPGQCYEFSGFTGAHRANVTLGIVFFDGAGAVVGQAEAIEKNNQVATGGTSLANFKRLWGKMVAPAAATMARIQFIRTAGLSGSDSWMMVGGPMAAACGPNITRPAPYAPSGLGTYITPAGISTPNLSAISANIGYVTAGRMDITGGDGGTGYMRSSNKGYRDGQAGWILARENAGASFISFEGGPCRLWMHSNGQAGWQSPGISMTDGGLTIDQLNVIKTLNVAGGAVNTAVGASGNGSVSVGIAGNSDGSATRIMAISFHGSGYRSGSTQMVCSMTGSTDEYSPAVIDGLASGTASWTSSLTMVSIFDVGAGGITVAASNNMGAKINLVTMVVRRP